MTVPSEPCPCEHTAPDGAPGPVADAELVMRHIPVSLWLVWDQQGQPRLTPAAFPEDELRGRKGKSVSVLRGLAAPAEASRRGIALTKEPAWKDDPVAALARVDALRTLVDRQQRREICVNADPVDTDLGFCAEHASILRASPPPDPSQRLEWMKLRLKLACRFASVSHGSGKPVQRILLP